MDFWELHQHIAASQENIYWLEAELLREKKRHARLHASLLAAAAKANPNQKIKSE
jgi:uncharacterized small protein (DUF1192 family)